MKKVAFALLTLVVLGFAFVGVMTVVSTLSKRQDPYANAKEIRQDQLFDYLKNKSVKEAQWQGNQLSGLLTNGQSFKVVVPDADSMGAEMLLNELNKSGARWMLAPDRLL